MGNCAWNLKIDEIRRKAASGTTRPLPLTAKEKARLEPRVKRKRRRKDKGPRLTPAERRHRNYSERNAIIRSMGFKTYPAYLKSVLWSSIRSRVLARSSACYICEAPATQVHHKTYRKCDLDGRDIANLYSICGGCHRQIEYRDRDQEKLNPGQATRKMKMMRTLRLKELRGDDAS